MDHKWQLVAQQRQQQKHICITCGATRLKTESSGSFPIKRYTSREGLIQYGKAPACSLVTEAA